MGSVFAFPHRHLLLLLHLKLNDFSHRYSLGHDSPESAHGE
jgi:hypothetical protein